MEYDIPVKYQDSIYKAISSINSHNCQIDTLLVEINGSFYGYQPYPQPQGKKFDKIPQERLDELHNAFNEAIGILAKEEMVLLVCFVSLNEGGSIIFIPPQALEKSLEIQLELEKMEEHHKQIS